MKNYIMTADIPYELYIKWKKYIYDEHGIKSLGKNSKIREFNSDMMIEKMEEVMK